MRETMSGRSFSWANFTQAILALLALGVSLTAVAQAVNRDYYNPGTDPNDQHIFKSVHQYHMGPGIEALGRRDWLHAYSEFLFILRYYPNQPDVLNLMSDLCVNRWKVPKCEIDSWFPKAIERNPNIAKTYVVYGIHLQRKGQYDEAIAALDQALKLQPDSINAHYTLGLLYVRKKDYEKANRHAQAAYTLGAELPGLREQLARAGKWKPLDNPVPPAAAEVPAVESNAEPAKTTPAGSRSTLHSPTVN